MVSSGIHQTFSCFFCPLLIILTILFMSVLMQSIRGDIEKENHAIQNSDIVVFFQVAQFVTSFQYHKFFASKVRY